MFLLENHTHILLQFFYNTNATFTKRGKQHKHLFKTFFTVIIEMSLRYFATFKFHG